VLTPHNAADTDPDEISKYRGRGRSNAFEGRRARFENVVDRGAGDINSIIPAFTGASVVIH